MESWMFGEVTPGRNRDNGGNLQSRERWLGDDQETKKGKEYVMLSQGQISELEIVQAETRASLILSQASPSSCQGEVI